MARSVVFVVLLACAGCFSLDETDKTTALVSNNPFGVEAPPAAPTKANYAPASQEVSLRVDRIGRELLCANPQIGLQPLFATIGAVQPEVFHLQSNLIYVTEGLVKQCRSNADLAAVLAAELGKMVAERESRLSPEVRHPDKLAPIRMPVGNGIGGREPDLTAVAELGRFEQTHPKTGAASLPRPDPQSLARGFLDRAGYQAADLDAAAPILQAAEKNVALERHLKGEMPQSRWTAP